MPRQNTAAAVVLGATAALTLTVASLWLQRSISEYGWKGTLRYIWEGDPYTPEVRDALETLEQLEGAIQEYEKALLHLELTLSQARLDTVDDAVVVPQWIITYAPLNLEKDLAKLSHDLDSLAAKADSVASSDNLDIKQRKKLCSQQLVFMMERADTLLHCYSQTEDTVDRS